MGLLDGDGEALEGSEEQNIRGGQGSRFERPDGRIDEHDEENVRLGGLRNETHDR